MKRKKINFPKTVSAVSSNTLGRLVVYALAEDLQVSGDITSDALFGRDDPVVDARVSAKENGVLCGMDAVETVYQTVDSSLSLKRKKRDGDAVKKGDVLFTLRGKTTSILKGERTALNFLGLLSGIATRVSSLASSIKKYKTVVLDTRKTLPGLRELEKYAVAVGGGRNHRMGLYDMVLIKENHVTAAGGVTAAVERARKKHRDIPVEIEVETLEQVDEALGTDADILMLDNMNNAMVKKSLERIGRRKYVEVSGNVDEKRLVELARLGVDFVSMGSLTHTIRNFDVSLRIG